ncbi:hypothetical protein AB0H82_01105 [Streptomyces sp. NPDC050732]|uniref:hypothetical protein n=1 Tax=Streptomyces sp. NPDC050732 TaxID=3154632 RepID=UPI003424F5F7
MAVVSFAAVAVMVGGAAAAAASVPSDHNSLYPGPEVSDTYHGDHDHVRDHDHPLHVGPFDVPRHGTVSGGFTWGLED